MLPGSACLLGLVQLRGRGCSAPCGVGWHYLEGSWCWEDRWELGVGTPGPLIWCHLNACIWFWLIVIAVRLLYIYTYPCILLLRGAIPMRHDGSSPSTDGAAAKPKPRPKPKPVPKAKTAQQEATKADLFFFSCHGHTQPNKFMHTTSPLQFWNARAGKASWKQLARRNPSMFLFTLIRLHVEIPA